MSTDWRASAGTIDATVAMKPQPAVAGGNATLMTFPVVDAEDMPNIAANAYSIAFGDVRRGTLVVDRAGVQVPRSVRRHSPRASERSSGEAKS